MNFPKMEDENASAIYKKVVATVVDSASSLLIGKKLSDEEREVYINAFAKKENVRLSNNSSTKSVYKSLYHYIIIPIVKQIILSDEYMVQ